MANYQRPSVYVEESLLSNNTISGLSTSTGAFLSANPRGPLVPTLVTSWTQYVAAFGGFTGSANPLPYALYQYFANGGRIAYVTRVVGTGAAVATRSLSDRAGTPVPTLKLDAKNPGAWANAIYVSITDGATGRFNLIVKSGGTTNDKIVEVWNDLSMNSTDSRYVVNILNAVGNGSAYLTATDLASASASPTNNPSVQADSILAGGADGSAPAASDYTTAAGLFDQVDSPLNLNCPGVTTAATLNTIISWAEARGDVFVVCDAPVGLANAAAAITYAQSLTVSSYAAVYWPNIVTGDPGSTTQGATRVQAPGGAVLGQFAATDATRGVFKAPAGLNARVAGAVALELKLTNADLDALNVAQVNAIRQVPGAGICIFGARTLKAGYSDKYLPIRRTLIYLKRALLDGTRYAIFEPNDSYLWASLQANISQFLLGFWQVGGLRGTTPSAAYYVKCDADNNTFSTIASGVVNVEVGVALQYPAEFIVIKIGQVEGGATATEG